MKQLQLFIIIVSLALPSAHASVVVTNLSQPNTSVWAAISPLGGDSQGDARAQQFSTPLFGFGWQITSLTFRLREVGSVPGSLTVQLYSNASGIPGTHLGTFVGANPDGNVGADYTYTPTTDIVLRWNTSYFALLTAPTSPGNFYEWQPTTSTFESSDPGWQETGNPWSIADVSRSNPSGITWGDGSPFKMAVSAFAVPEPSSLTLMGLSGLVIALARRRRLA